MWHLPAADTYFANLLTPAGFEIDHLDEALKFCTKFRTALDGGAHIGTWAVRLSNRFNSVVAVEPAPDTYACLVENLKQYKANNVICCQAALGARAGTCRLVDDPTRIGNTGARVTFYGDGLIRVRTIDDFKFEDLDFLKLDLEGSETLALRGALQTIKNCRPVIVVECKEFNPVRNGGVKATKDLLAILGYQEVGGIRNDRVFVPK